MSVRELLLRRAALLEEQARIDRELAELRSETPVDRHTQADGARPPGVERSKYLRTWRAAHEAGDLEVWVEGRARCMSSAAWARWARTAPPAPVVIHREPSVDAELASALGLAPPRAS